MPEEMNGLTADFNQTATDGYSETSSADTGVQQQQESSDQDKDLESMLHDTHEELNGPIQPPALRGGQQQEGQQRQAVPGPLKDFQHYASQKEMQSLSGLPQAIQQDIASVLGRVTQTAQSQYEVARQKEEMLNSVAETIYPILEQKKTIEPAAQAAGFSDYNDYVDHLIGIDKEITLNPARGIASVIFDYAGTSQQSLKQFTWAIQQAIYDIRNSVRKAAQDPYYRQQLAAPRQAEMYKKQLEQMQQQYQETLFGGVQQSFEEPIRLFASETNANGELTHPYFNQVRDQMSVLSRTSGSTDLQYLYDTACYSNPEIRQALIAEQLQVKQPAQRPNFAMTNSPSVTQGQGNVKRSDGSFKDFEELLRETESELQYRRPY